MELPIRFPDPLQEAARRADAFQRLPPDERLRQLMDTVATGLALLRVSPHRETNDRLYQQHEADWRRIQKELFTRHVA